MIHSQLSRTLTILPMVIVLAGCGDEPARVQATPIRINELASSNDVYQDLVGDTDDWIELYNDSDTDFSLEGYYVSDDVDERFKSVLAPGVVVPARGVLLVWADGQPRQSSSRAPHLAFQLSSEGEGVWLSNPSGFVVDFVEFAALPLTSATELWTSLSRFPDGTGSFGWCSTSTPEELNGTACAGETL
jgi:hypothetical protein